MNVIPIQVTDEGVLIPKQYLHDADEVEVVVEADYVLVKPKRPDTDVEANAGSSKPSHRYSFIGIGHTRDPKASMEVEDILERGADRRDGWTLQS